MFVHFNLNKDDLIHNAKHLGQDVSELDNSNPGLKVNRSINYSRIKMFFTAHVLRTLR